MLKKGIYENIISHSVERDIQEAESQELVCLREQIDAAESMHKPGFQYRYSARIALLS